MASAFAAIAALAVLNLVLVRALVSERRAADKHADLLLTRIQAPELAPMLAVEPETDPAPQWESEEQQERAWAEANGSEFMAGMEAMNGDR